MRALMSHVLPRVAQVNEGVCHQPAGSVPLPVCQRYAVLYRYRCWHGKEVMHYSYRELLRRSLGSLGTCVYLSLFDAPSKMDARVLSPDQLGGFRVVAQFARRGPPDSRTSSADYYLRAHLLSADEVDVGLESRKISREHVLRL